MGRQSRKKRANREKRHALEFVRDILREAKEGIPGMKQIMSNALYCSQESILRKVSQGQMIHRDPDTGVERTITLDAMNDDPDESIYITLVWAAIAASSWLTGRAKGITTPDDLLDIMAYWLEQDDCLFYPAWPFTKEQAKQVWRKKHPIARKDEVSEERVKHSLANFTELGLLGRPHIDGSGDISYQLTPEFHAFTQWLLSHPEKWDENPALAECKAELSAAREQAIASGYINP